jgi:hypothetical protein
MVLLGLLAAMMLAASPVLAWQTGIACVLRDHTLWEQRISSASSSPGRASIPQWVRSICRVNFLSFLSLFTNFLEGFSANFACTQFSEVRIASVQQPRTSKRGAVCTGAMPRKFPNLVHLGDALTPFWP